MMDIDSPVAFFYDTETTGIPNWREPSESPEQPHIVAIACALVEVETGRVQASCDLIVRPEGWEIPPEAAAIHGISHEHAMRYGVSEDAAVNTALELWAARPRVGHNESFDRRMIRIALKRAGHEQQAELWRDAESHCTCLGATPVCKLPKAKGAGFKRPTLGEAYRHFTGEELPDAHTAWGDLAGTIRVFQGIRAAGGRP